MGLILDSSVLIAEERENFDLAAWLRSRRPEPVAASAITFSELWFGIEAAIARLHARTWARLAEAGRLIGPHDLIVAATALHRHWAVATFNAREFQQVHGLAVIQP